MRRKLLLILAFISVLYVVSAIKPNHKQNIKLAEKTTIKEETRFVPESNLQVPIKKGYRVANATGAQCGWCSIETLGRYNKIRSLYDLTEKHKGLINGQNGPHELIRRNVDFKYQPSGIKDISILRKYVTEKRYGVAVGLHKTHMLVLCHFDEKQHIVKVIDNIGTKALEIQTWNMDKFLDLWDGCVYVVIPDDKRNYPDIG